jgi:hypothetical protein
LIEDFKVPFCVGGSDRGGAFEHHVLEKVGDAGDSGPLVGRTHVRHEGAGDARLPMPLDHQHFEPIWQRFLDDRNLLRRNLDG